MAVAVKATVIYFRLSTVIFGLRGQGSDRLKTQRTPTARRNGAGPRGGRVEEHFCMTSPVPEGIDLLAQAFWKQAELAF